VVARTRDNRSFEEIGEELRSFTVAHEDTAAVGKWLDSLDGIQRMSWVRCDKDGEVPFGSTFQTRLQSALSTSAPRWWDSLDHGEVGAPLLEFWREREKWRTEWPQKAAARTRECGQSGLRVSDLVWVAAKDLSDAGALVSSVLGEHVDIGAIESQVHDQVLRRDLRLYFKIVTEVYDSNFADRIGCRNASLNLDIDEAAVTLGPVDEWATEDDALSLGDVFLPSERQLDRLRLVDLEELRIVGENIGYYKQLRRWMDSGRRADAFDYAETLLEYGHRICERTRMRFSEDFSVLGFTRRAVVPTFMGGAALAAIGLLFQSSVAQVVEGGASALLTLVITEAANRKRPRQKRHDIRLYERPVPIS
jgi:hypothetical protein